MGVAVSSQATISSLSLVSTIFGFISFTFTLATLLRVFWTEFCTFLAAAGEMPDYLTNLKQQLYEENWHLKRARRLRGRRRSDHHAKKDKFTIEKDRDDFPDYDLALKAMQSAVRYMIATFTRLERPFLKHPDQETGKSRRKMAERWDDDVYNQYSDDGLSEAGKSYISNDYKNCGFRERYIWVKTKSNIENVQRGISSITLRRSGMQVSILACGMRDLGRDIDEFDDRIYGIQQRLSRIVGVRRVD